MSPQGWRRVSVLSVIPMGGLFITGLVTGDDLWVAGSCLCGAAGAIADRRAARRTTGSPGVRDGNDRA